MEEFQSLARESGQDAGPHAWTDQERLFSPAYCCVWSNHEQERERRACGASPNVGAGRARSCRLHTRRSELRRKQMEHSHETHPETLSLDRRSNPHEPDDPSCRRGAEPRHRPADRSQVRAFLAEINKDSSPFWELPQPKPQDILTGLQSRRPSTCRVSRRRADHHPGRPHREALHHEARACQRKAGRAALHPRRRLDRRQFPKPSAPAARPRRRLGTDRRVRRIYPSAGSEISDPAGGVLRRAEMGVRARRRVRRRWQPHRRRRQLGRRQHDGRAGADGQGPQRSEDQLSGAPDPGDRRERRHRVLSRISAPAASWRARS